MNVLVASGLLVLGIILYFAFKPKPKVVVVEKSSIPVEASVNSEKEAEVAVKPVAKRVYKKRGVNGVKETGDKEGGESK